MAGIWYTENRYFFIDATGVLTDIEPVSTEIIHDFSGSFTVDNMNVTGTIYLDHTPVGGIRNAHGINYSGLFVNNDEINMDWDVPMADTGLENWRIVPYNGITDQAAITAGNASILAVNTWISGETGAAVGIVGSVKKSPETANVSLNMYDMFVLFDNIILQIDKAADFANPMVGAAVAVNETENGPCGGNLQIIGSGDNETGVFDGTVSFNNYCMEAITLNGTADLTGNIDLISEEFMYYLFTYKNLTVEVLGKSVTIDGRTGGNFTFSPPRILLSYVVTDNAAAKSYWLKDLILRITENIEYVEISDLTGRYYDPDYGYVDLIIEEAIRLNDSDMWPSSGSMVLIGSQGTKARLTFLSATEYRVDADTDGDGLYDDYTSGTQLWAEL